MGLYYTRVIRSAYTRACWVVERWLSAGWRGWELVRCSVHGLNASAITMQAWRVTAELLSSVHIERPKKLSQDAFEGWQQQQQSRCTGQQGAKAYRLSSTVFSPALFTSGPLWERLCPPRRGSSLLNESFKGTQKTTQI